MVKRISAVKFES